MERIYDLPFCFYNLIYLRQKNGRGFQTELFRNFLGLIIFCLKRITIQLKPIFLIMFPEK